MNIHDDVVDRSDLKVLARKGKQCVRSEFRARGDCNTTAIDKELHAIAVQLDLVNPLLPGRDLVE